MKGYTQDVFKLLALEIKIMLTLKHSKVCYSEKPLKKIGGSFMILKYKYVNLYNPPRTYTTQYEKQKHLQAVFRNLLFHSKSRQMPLCGHLVLTP